MLWDFLSFFSNYPFIPPRSEVPAVLSDFIVILSFRSGYLLCHWTAYVWSEVPAVLFGWPLSSVQGTYYASDYCHTVGSEVPAVLSDYCQCLVRCTYCAFELLSNQTIHYPFHFHLPFHSPFLLPFRLPFPFLFPSLPQDLGRNSLGDTSCIRSLWAYTLIMLPPPYWFAKPRWNNYLSNAESAVKSHLYMYDFILLYLVELIRQRLESLLH